MPAIGDDGGVFFADNGTCLEGDDILLSGGVVVTVWDQLAVVRVARLGLAITVSLEAAHVIFDMNDAMGLSESAWSPGNGVPVIHGSGEHGSGILYGTEADYEEDIFGVEEFTARMPALLALEEEEEEKVAVPGGSGSSSSYRRSLVQGKTATNKAKQQDRVAFTNMRVDEE
eukprot:jgi/Chlat1/1609/Chrsp127S01870